ncbi:MAG: GTPase Era [Gammaproteobacteria bacterium]|nr:GTPase Era [Gammaproteobacteria bacterium]
MSNDFRCGFAGVVGRPNVGKSTLVNAILGQKVSITSPKPQTTRHRILGIKNSAKSQLVFVDTPGINYREARAINRYMNRAAHGAIADVDVILLVVEAMNWTEQDSAVQERISRAGTPVILVINKIDLARPRDKALPYVQACAARGNFDDIVPVSARRGENLARLEQVLESKLPSGEPVFPTSMITDRSDRFIAAELIREKLMRRLDQEVPYRLSVEIEQMKPRRSVLHVGAVIWVERPGQKAIVIGRSGEMIKRIGTLARRDMQRTFGCGVHLDLWVKVKAGWSDDERALTRLGYVE